MFRTKKRRLPEDAQVPDHVSAKKSSMLPIPISNRKEASLEAKNTQKDNQKIPLEKREQTTQRPNSSSIENLFDTTTVPLCNNGKFTKKATLPDSLVSYGNKYAWERVCTRLLTSKSPLLLFGPSGCGKTKGIHECCKHKLGMRPYEINGSCDLQVDDMILKLDLASNSKTLLGPRLIVFDDIEMFEQERIAAIHRFIQKRTRKSSPIVIICNDPYSIGLRPFREYERIKLQVPNEASCKALATNVCRGRCSQTVINRVASECLGNFHQICILINSFSVCTLSSLDDHVNLFETSKKLLKKEMNMSIERDAAAWGRCGSQRALISIMFENYTSFVTTDNMEECANVSEMLSLVVSTHETTFTDPTRRGSIDFQVSDFCTTYLGLNIQQHSQLTKQSSCNLKLSQLHC